MSRLVPAASLIRDQVDFYDPPGSVTRATGISVGDIIVTVFANNVALAWTTLDGTAVPDSSISAGTVYFNEIPGNPGFYSIRFFPDRIGFWRIVVSDSAISAESVREFDVAPAGTFSPSNGLNASFTL